MTPRSQKEIQKTNDLLRGATVTCIQMVGETLPPGTKGSVKMVDGIGQIHVNWENGSGLALVPEVDSFVVALPDGNTFLWTQRRQPELVK